jgi:hypothetical protein
MSIQTARAAANPVTREVQSNGYRVRLDLSQQVLRLGIPKEYGWPDAAAEEKLVPRLRDVPGASPDFVSGALLVQKAKQFDDGLYAAVELAAQKGAGSFAGKSALLSGLATRLARQSASPTDRVIVLAACRLGAVDAGASPDVAPSVERALRDFLGDELASKPLGFYGWSPELERIFRQDRWLQRPLGGDAPRVLATAIAGDALLRDTYSRYLGLVERLTNPFPPEWGDLRQIVASGNEREAGRTKIAVFPPSASHEGELVKRMFGGAPIPEGFSLVDELVTRLRSGALRVEPTPRSGWYDHQTWANAALVVPESLPEARHLDFDESYRKELVDLFKAAQALARETHVKQLEVPHVGAALPPPVTYVDVTPGLTVEPLVTFYERRAQSYRFVRTALEEAFGPAGLGQMARLTSGGPTPGDLASQLSEMEDLFVGAAALAAKQIGHVAPPAPRASEAMSHFESWRASLTADSDLDQDARMMVPIFHDAQRKRTKVWVFLGWTARRLAIDFAERPAATVLDAGGRPVKLGDRVQLRFPRELHTLAVPVTAEVYVTRVLDRQEFRARCDQLKTRKAILASLQ